MSREDAQSFLQRLQEDSAFRRTVSGAAGGDDAQSLIAVAADHGLTFTAGELVAALKAQPSGTRLGELSDAELKGVAGGLTRDEMFEWMAAIIRKYDATTKAVVQNLRG
jgi:predicted ribosomally synthesized peptide with nif11-like leader